MAPFPNAIALAGISGGDGFAVAGPAAYSATGYSISRAGDVNGDGVEDFIVGAAWHEGGARAGAAYVVFGKAGGPVAGAGATLDLAALGPGDGFRIVGASSFDYAGVSASAAGDVNGDGFDDIVVGADRSNSDGADAGEAYVVFGRSSGFGAVVAGVETVSAATLSPQQGFVIRGDAAGDRAGFSVSGGGDFNGDGLADIVIGARNGDDGGSNAGEAYVVFGSTSGFGVTVGVRTVVDLTSLSPAQGLVIHGPFAEGQAGFSVAFAGDVDGDGFDDIAIGAPFADSERGMVAIVSGGQVSPGTLIGGRQVVNLGAALPGEVFTFAGEQAGSRTGWSVASAGDVNGDGVGDLIVGAPWWADAAVKDGRAYVIFGSAGGLPAIDLASLTPQQGFVIDAPAGDVRTGTSVAAAGDVNGDGFDDLIVGSPFDDSGGFATGAAHVIFGRAGDFGVLSGGRRVVDLSAQPSGAFVTLFGEATEDLAGYAVAGLGDIDGDGYADFGVGAFGAAPAGVETGKAHVLYGREADGPVDITGAAGNQTMRGSAFGDILRGMGGNDLLFGKGGADELHGGEGNDRIDGGGGSDHMLGGSGDDIFFVDHAGDQVEEGAGEGHDIVHVSLSAFVLPANAEEMIFSGTGGFHGVGNALANVIEGSSGGDMLDGAGGADLLRGGAGNDTYVLDSPADAISEISGNDTILAAFNCSLGSYQGIENITITGVASHSATGDNAANRLTGNTAGNRIDGRGGDDFLHGGASKDILTGGSGRDDFDFDSTRDAGRNASRDRITDFRARQDDLDLRGIDADSRRGGDQKFRFIGEEEFSGKAGELRFEKVNKPGKARDDTIVEGDVNGDGRADFQIELDGLISLARADFFF
jgi:hypothetical protein